MKTLNIYTCQMSAQRNMDKGLLFLDVTVKSGDPAFAPTWKMVTSYKAGTLSWEDYTSSYHLLMKSSYRTNRAHWEDLIIRALSTRGLVLVCYCPKGTSECHRHLLKNYFAGVAGKMGLLVQIHPEV